MENADSPQREIIQAMILGDQREIPKDILEKFNRTGTSHIIAISGFNVGIVAFFSIFVIRFILILSEYLLLRFNIIKLSIILSLIPIIIFAFIAGMGISVIRATIMVIAFMAAIFLGKERDLYNTLALAAFIILAVSPASLFDISFQLSFTAVAAILFITPCLSRLGPITLIEDKLKQTPQSAKIFHNMVLFVSVTISAIIGTLPLIVFYFNRLSNISLVANIIVVPLMGIIAIPVCMAIIFTAPLSMMLTIFFIKFASFLIEISLSIVDFLDSLPASSLILSTPTFLEISAYYLLVITIVILIDKQMEKGRLRDAFTPWLKGACVALALFFVFDGIYFYARAHQHKNIYVSVIDVGQGSSTLIRFPGGTTMLIDGGGFSDDSFDIGKYVVAPFLLYQRTKKIDFLVLTHPHPDHLNGLIYILENFNIKEVWTNGQTSEIKAYEDLLNIMKKKNIVHRMVSEKTKNMKIEGVDIKVFNPERVLNNEKGEPDKFYIVNNNSLVIKLTFGKIKTLVTGDIQDTTERRLVESNKDMTSDIIIVPHHGGFTSSTSEFLRRVRPKLAVISCGYNNMYRDPHPDVLQRYRSLNVKIYRTDINGAVTIASDGLHISSKPFIES